MEEPGRLQSMGSLRVGHDWATSLSLSCIGEGNGNPLQCSCLENPRDGEAWWAAVSGVAQSRIRLKRLSSSSSSSSIAVRRFNHTHCCSVTQSCPSLCDPIGCSKQSFPVHHFLELAQTYWLSDAVELVILSNHLILCHSLLLLHLIFPSIAVFPNESLLLIRWPNYLSFSFSISPSIEYSGWFPLGWTGLLAGHGILKSLLQHHSSKASILWCSAFFMVQSMPYIPDFRKNHSFD